ncbi:cysteine proteinase [Dothidotthia symphoricarpi CBS 119687]|uniref:Ubiquitin carboxyl-terminal hydrolase n=1 Tax=Dothidotthia symphoricarpi CBS 119687 TaxID=1392245 RepID=A0A6A6AQ81_9PLEO|nr:cysteine proteinase [Dothidotthia symphoricarpi CBS 119687]KAF2133353.1 cysteine proteinase [Dothidotthia symphoricarpi CBS 119687]
MPEKPLTIATYAAGASLAAITLVYVFGPTYFLDDDATSSKKKGAVGLSNAANDCFINSVLQALAGLPDLRIYLIRETHRRKLDGPEVYEVDLERLSADDATASPGKLENLQTGVLTYGLKNILDHLNERPIYRKTISPQPFIISLEKAFGTRISRQQQDAQEFLQIVTERLCDEYHAGTKARRQAQRPASVTAIQDGALEPHEIAKQLSIATSHASGSDSKEEAHDTNSVLPEEEGFPFEGKIESQIECQTCKFKPKPSASTFVTLTLNVPHVASTSLNACFDGMLKVEHIEDFKCEWCRLEHALRSKDHELSKATDDETRERLQSDIVKIRKALDEDPETPPEGVELPDSKQAPKRRIARHMYISQFPKVLAVHLSRSMFAVGTVSTKNLAKVSFPESLPLGGLLHRKNYRLLGMVTHKGSHNSGHYESFRRQVQAVPFSTPHSFGTEGAYSRHATPLPSATHSAVPTPRISTSNLTGTDRASLLSSIRPLDSPSTGSLSSQSSKASYSRGPAPTSAPRVNKDSGEFAPPPDMASLSSVKTGRSLKERASEKAASLAEANPLKRKSKRANNRWWRISDDKIKESKTGEVLGMQKEVYLLFYELDRSS